MLDEVPANKLGYVQAYTETMDPLEPTFFLQALINCLSPSESCSMLDTDFRDNKFREFLLKKIVSDSKENFERCHENLINLLISKANQPDFKKRDSCAYVLNTLYGTSPQQIKEQIIVSFLSSNLTVIRNRAYKILLEDWNDEFADTIFNLWTCHQEYYCQELIIKKFSADYLMSIYDEISNNLPLNSLSKLVIKLAPYNNNYVFSVKEIDEITYLYICASLKLAVGEEEACRIVDNNYSDERLGLMLWSLGKLKSWKTIKYFIEVYRDRISFDHFGNISVKSQL